MKKEKTRQHLIRLLKECESTFDAREPKALKSVLFSDLISNGYLEGVTNRDENGIPNANHIINITMKGRLYLGELEALQQEATFWSKLKKHFGAVGLWLLGIATPMIVDAIKKFFTK